MSKTDENSSHLYKISYQVENGHETLTQYYYVHEKGMGDVTTIYNQNSEIVFMFSTNQPGSEADVLARIIQGKIENGEREDWDGKL